MELRPLHMFEVVVGEGWLIVAMELAMFNLERPCQLRTSNSDQVGLAIVLDESKLQVSEWHYRPRWIIIEHERHVI